MSSLAKSAMLSLGLLAGVACAANAQSDNLANLPPGAAAAPPAAVTSPVAPSAKFPGIDPGQGWYPSSEQQTQAVQPSGKFPGIDPGQGWYPSSEQQTQAVQPSAEYPGPKPN
jgi:hypothetical protein